MKVWKVEGGGSGKLELCPVPWLKQPVLDGKITAPFANRFSSYAGITLITYMNIINDRRWAGSVHSLYI